MAIHTALSPASQLLSPSLLPLSPALAELILLRLWHLIINWITFPILDRSNFYLDLFSNSHYHHHLQVAVSANPVGSSKQPESITKTSFATKSPHQVEIPITKQLYSCSKPSHVQTPTHRGTSTL